MNLSEGRLAPVSGSSGLVVRVPGAVLFVAARTPAEQVRALTAVVGGHTEPTPARALARELAALVAADDEGTLPGFGLVATSAGGTYVKVYGGVEVHLAGATGTETLTGVGSFTGVDREIAGPFTTIAAHAAGRGAADPDDDIDIQGGTAAGDGFVLVASPASSDPGATTPSSTTAAAAGVAPPTVERSPVDASASPPVEPPADEPPADDGAVAPVATVDLPPTQPLAEPTSYAEPPQEPPGVASSIPPIGEAPPRADEAADVAAMNVVSTPSTPPSAGPDDDVVAPAAEAAEELDAPTQAWTPSTADFDADDVDAGTGAPAPAEPAWGSAEPDPAPAATPSLDKGPADDSPLLDVPAEGAPADQSSWYVPPVAAEAPGTPTPAPEGGSTIAAPEPSAAAAQPTAWEDLPVADDAAPAPSPTEAATMAIPPMPATDEATDAAPPADAPPATFTSQLLGALDDEDGEEREALPVELDPAEVRQTDNPMTEEVLVQGVICSRGHFNDPRSRFCSSCGISMVQNTQILTQGPRPPLGVMVFEDGATFSLSSDYVVGRQPDVHELVQQGLALPLPVDDPERSISRAHAELRLVDWDVHLVNLSGTNGSFVWDENGQTWIPIPEGQSVVLTPGMRVALGRRSAVFESSLVR